MFVAVVLIGLLPILVASSGDGNIWLLEEEITAAIKACIPPKESRQRRSEEGYDEQYGNKTPRIDNNAKQENNQYDHERRNTSDFKDQIHILNATDYDYAGYGAGNVGEKLVNAVPRPVNGGGYSNDTTNLNRTRRSEPLLNKDNSDQCLSQCVFANLQILSRRRPLIAPSTGELHSNDRRERNVDTRGIPREAELWNKVQSSVTSQQSRAALKDQVRACFQELQTEAEDNGCSYSNKLERCLMLRFSDRKTNGTQETNQKT